MAPTAKKKLSASLEDYLEIIGRLVHEGGVARVRDIARELDVAMPSVTSALKALSGRGLVNYSPYELVTLTGRGLALAEGVDRRHKILRRFLTEFLGLDAESAEANACRMEHSMDEAALDRLDSLARFLRQSRTWGRTGEKKFAEFRKDRTRNSSGKSR